MKLLRRNRTTFTYYAYTGLDSDLDENGLHTGEPHPVFAEPVTMKGNISAPSGSATQTFYGLDIRYTHVLLLDNPNAGIRETGYIEWNGEVYDITAVIPSMNVLSVALRQRTKDNGDQYEEPEGDGDQHDEPAGEGDQHVEPAGEGE